MQRKLDPKACEKNDKQYSSDKNKKKIEHRHIFTRTEVYLCKTIFNMKSMKHRKAEYGAPLLLWESLEAIVYENYSLIVNGNHSVIANGDS